jgi:hypothetical protein
MTLPKEEGFTGSAEVHNYVLLILALYASHDDANMYDADTYLMKDNSTDTGSDLRLGTIFLTQLALAANHQWPCVRYEVPDEMRLPNYSYRYILRKLLLCIEAGSNVDGSGDCTIGGGNFICGAQVQTMLFDLHDLLRPAAHPVVDRSKF